MTDLDPNDPLQAAALRIVAANRSAREASSGRIARLIEAIQSEDEDEFSNVVEKILDEVVEGFGGSESGEGSTGVDGPEAESGT